MIPQNDIKFRKLKHGLYVVSTPIGNLADITFRAIDVLKNSEYILCEDTRVSKKLLDKYKIRSKLISHHKFNETKNLKKSGKAGLFSGSLELVKEGSLLIKQEKLFDEIYIKQK